ncbi:hypothetical protein [Cardinium endosymbiont of Sogatella furcifera]|uniref:hypothetical protein n=1 Tax=Cardinium endosymbiont of Sogatella furcifera TaxID=650378 RepID=UPI000E0D56DB|nr:hypothetical protein [Cardinium endosymbiont of Sogatella furcifera]
MRPTFFSKLVDGLLWGSSLVLTAGCIKMSGICQHILEASAQISAQREDSKVRSLKEFSFLEFMTITCESNNPLLLHKFFKDITTHLPRLSYLFNQCGPVLYGTLNS